MHWNFSKWDWGEILSILAPALALAFFINLLGITIGVMFAHFILRGVFGY